MIYSISLFASQALSLSAGPLIGRDTISASGNIPYWKILYARKSKRWNSKLLGAKTDRGIATKMKSQAKRDLMFELIEKGKSKLDVAALLGIHRSTVHRWLRTGNIRLPPRGPRLGKRKLTVEQESAVISHVDNSPGNTQSRLARYIQQAFQVHVAINTVALILKRADYTHKKAVKRNTEYDVQRGMQFLQELRELSADRCVTLASIDEASFHLNSAPRYAWARRGSRAVIRRPMIRGTRFSLLLCVCPSGVVDYTLVQGSVNSALFTTFIGTLRRNLTLLLDNVSTHRATKSLWKKDMPSVRESAESRSITLKFTPPYAPHLNPVEYCFNTVRAYINRQQPRDENELRLAVAEGIRSLSPASLSRLFTKVIDGDP